MPPRPICALGEHDVAGERLAPASGGNPEVVAGAGARSARARPPTSAPVFQNARRLRIPERAAGRATPRDVAVEQHSIWVRGRTGTRPPADDQGLMTILTASPERIRAIPAAVSSMPIVAVIIGASVSAPLSTMRMAVGNVKFEM